MIAPRLAKATICCHYSLVDPDSSKNEGSYRPSTERRRTGEGRARVHGRSARVVHDVLAATRAELGRRGYAGLRIEDVAARAGVNKTTIYRRWPTKIDLVGAAIREFVEIDAELPDNGDVRADLLELFGRTIARAQTEEGRALIRLLATERGNPELDGIAAAFREERMAHRAALVERAIARGELPPGTDARLVVEVMFSALHARLCQLEPALEPGFMPAVVDLVLAGARSGERSVAGGATAGAPRPRRRGTSG